MSALGQLVSGVAHELNNPLSVIVGYGQLLLAREVPSAVLRPIELMVSQADRMAKIVRNLLLFARQRPAERTTVNLNDVLEQTLALRINQLTISAIAVEKKLTRGLPSVLADQHQLEQVFLNLMLNAEQAMLEAKTGGRITLVTGVMRDGRSVYAEVIDDGPGIPPDALSHVFEPFFTTKTVGTGTGLGLSVSYGIVEDHGGHLGVESRPGRTVFRLELPVAQSTAAQRAQPSGSPMIVTGDGRSALVVEDEASVLDLIVTILSQTGWRVDVASGGREGLERVREHRYDLIVSDIRMPDGGGEEFYRDATADNPSLGNRFIFITGDTANREAFSVLRDAGVLVLEKPFQPAFFLDAVRRVTS
jgi:CheY-like chemotaxis protein